MVNITNKNGMRAGDILTVMRVQVQPPDCDKKRGFAENSTLTLVQIAAASPPFYQK
jgi:hypothetical protein